MGIKDLIPTPVCALKHATDRLLCTVCATGEAPWWHKEQKELQRKIAHTKLRLPTWLTNEAKAIIRGLLT